MTAPQQVPDYIWILACAALVMLLQTVYYCVQSGMSRAKNRITVSDEMTAREQAVRALRRAEEKYRGIFENAIEGIFQTSPDGHYLEANPALARIYGYDSVQQLRASVEDIEHQLYVDPNRRCEFVELMKKHDSIAGFESQIFRRDGSKIWISENVRVVRNSQHCVLFYEGTVEDITERKDSEGLAPRQGSRRGSQRSQERVPAHMSHETARRSTA